MSVLSLFQQTASQKVYRFGINLCPSHTVQTNGIYVINHRQIVFRASPVLPGMRTLQDQVQFLDRKDAFLKLFLPKHGYGHTCRLFQKGQEFPPVRSFTEPDLRQHTEIKLPFQPVADVSPGCFDIGHPILFQQLCRLLRLLAHDIIQDPLPGFPVGILSVIQIMLIILRPHAQSFQKGILQKLWGRSFAVFQIREHLLCAQAVSRLLQLKAQLQTEFIDVGAEMFSLFCISHEIFLLGIVAK